MLKSASKSIFKRVKKSPNSAESASESASKSASKTNIGVNGNRNAMSLRYIGYQYLKGLHGVTQRRKIGLSFVTPNRGARYLQLIAKLTDPTQVKKFMNDEVLEAVALAANCESVIVSRERGLILIDFELDRPFWETYTRQNVKGAGIGLVNRLRQVDMAFTHDQSQVLIVGTTGSGKSVTIQSSLFAIMSSHSPEQARFLIVDPHKDHTGFENSAYLLHPIAHKPAEIAATILQAEQIFLEREGANNRNDYRLIVLIDEITELLERQPELFDSIARLVNGRKFNIHVIAGAHVITQTALPDPAKFTLRLVGKLGIHGSYSATGIEGLAAHKLTGMGDFYYINHGQATRFQVAMPTAADFELLERIAPNPLTLNGSNEVARVQSVPVIDQPAIEDKPIGRPPATIEPDILARYLNDSKLSIRSASELGYGRIVHNLHKNFASELVEQLNKLGLFICKE